MTRASFFLQTGMFKLSEEEFFIQPLEKSDDEMSAAQAHAIYKRHAEPPSSPRVTSVSGKQAPNGTCAVEGKWNYWNLTFSLVIQCLYILFSCNKTA